jgi:hypothetical protein
MCASYNGFDAKSINACNLFLTVLYSMDEENGKLY